MGELRRVSRRGRAPAPRHRPVRATPPRRAAALRDGRAGRPPGGSDRGRHGGHAPARHRGPVRGSHRLLDVADVEPPDGDGRPHAVAARTGRRAGGDRPRRGRRRTRRGGADLGLLARPRRRIRHDQAAGRADGLPPVGLARPEPSATRGVARPARSDCAGGRRRAADPGPGGPSAGGAVARPTVLVPSLLGPPRVPRSRRAASRGAGGRVAQPRLPSPPLGGRTT